MAEMEHVVGEVKGKIAILFDDMIDTGGTLLKAIDMLQRQNVKKIYVGATHPIFSGNAIEELENSKVEEIVVVDTIPINKEYGSKKIKVLSIAPLLAKTIKKVYHCMSVSELFKGENLV